MHCLLCRRCGKTNFWRLCIKSMQLFHRNQPFQCQGETYQVRYVIRLIVQKCCFMKQCQVGHIFSYLRSVCFSLSTLSLVVCTVYWQCAAANSAQCARMCLLAKLSTKINKHNFMCMCCKYVCPQIFTVVYCQQPFFPKYCTMMLTFMDPKKKKDEK